MTAAAFNNMKMVASGAMPFAYNGTVTAPGNTSSSGFCVPDGFGSSFDAAPTDDGSNMVQRGQMNFIGKMASYSPFFFQCGGYYTFNPAVATGLTVNNVKGIGGYPSGAILSYVEGHTLVHVMSLKDDNKVDFTGQTNRSTYTDITNGSIDGENWLRLKADTASVDPILLNEADLGEINTSGIQGALHYMICSVCSGVVPRKGAITSTMKMKDQVTGLEMPTSGQQYELSLLYKQPGDADYTTVKLASYAEQQASAMAAVELKSGTLFTINFSMSHLHFKDITITTTLI